MSGRIVDKYNPKKVGVLRHKRAQVRAGQSGRSVGIRELTFPEVREDVIDFGLVTSFVRQMKSGKEASLFVALRKKHTIVVEVYRLWLSANARHKQGFLALEAAERLAVREYDILCACFRSGVLTPTPISRVGTYLTMRIICTDGDPAPRLE
ncbi:hypothetical protein EU538_10365 [Candidatus Thorarchaeota archaeon]|nr:MAG: hypothetical protein EU538_10365 [Candidatus Thorarchaeota archaeon]